MQTNGTFLMYENAAQEMRVSYYLISDNFFKLNFNCFKPVTISHPIMFIVKGQSDSQKLLH